MRLCGFRIGAECASSLGTTSTAPITGGWSLFNDLYSPCVAVQSARLGKAGPSALSSLPGYLTLAL